jgi:hypothetical protein
MFGTRAVRILLTAKITSISNRGSRHTYVAYSNSNKNAIQITNNIVQLINENKFTEALAQTKQFVNDDFKRKDKFFTVILNTLKKNNQIDQMQTWMHAMEINHQMQPNPVHINIFLETLGKKSIAEARQYFDAITEKQLQHYNVMIEIYKRNVNHSIDMLKQAEMLFDDMGKCNIKPDAITFTTMISCYTYRVKANVYANRVKSNAWAMHKAEDLLHKMLSSGFTPKIWTFNIMIEAYANSAKMNANIMQKAEILFDTMVNLSVKPDIITYNTMIKGYANGVATDGTMATKAELLLEKMISSGMKPDLITFNSLLYAFANTIKVDGESKNEIFEKILNLYESMKLHDVNRDEGTYANFLDAIVKLQLYKISDEQKYKPETYVQKMIDEGITPNANIMSTLARWAMRDGKDEEKKLLNDTLNRFYKHDNVV